MVKRTITYKVVTAIYRVTKTFPEEEKFGIVSQIRRSAVSVPSNIAEGAARNSKREFKNFLYVALGSLSELDTQLTIAKNIGYSKDECIFQRIESIKKMILGLIRFLTSRITTDHFLLFTTYVSRFTELHRANSLLEEEE